jgi:quinoprotein glucose dehydrogenase
MTFRTVAGAGLALALACVGLSQSTKSTSRQTAPGEDWATYGGSPEGTRYSTLKQIDRSNVSRLQVAWTFDAAAGDGRPGRGGLQTQSIVVNGRVYGNTPGGRVIALDGATGKSVWTWDSNNNSQRV